VCPVPYNLPTLCCLREAGSCRFAQECSLLALSLQTSRKLQQTQPEFDEAGKIVSFHSRADRNFRLKAKGAL
jgi:hypothetical protein